MQQGVCIDVYSFGPKGIETPASKLAREGRVAAVELLIELGANTDRIIPGFILGGHDKTAQSFQLRFVLILILLVMQLQWQAMIS